MNNIYATPLPFELVAPLHVWKGARRVRTVNDAILVDLIFEPPIYDDPMTPAYVFATWPAGAAGYEAACILPPDTDPATLTAEFLASREWAVGREHRFTDRALRCPLDYERAGASAVAALSRAGAPVSRRAVYDFQRRRRDAIAALETQWMQAEAERLARTFRHPDETDAERAVNDTRDIAAALEALLSAGLILSNMGATTVAQAEQTKGDGPTPGREDAFWLAALAKDAAEQAQRLAAVYARYQGHVTAVVARIRQNEAQP
jgi:hypothetical protein